MIIKESKITIKNQTATIDEDIYLFKNDRNIELRFQIAKLSYAFTNDDNDNLILGTNASHFLIKMKKDELEYNFGIQRTEEGKARLLITHELIDEDVELGDYDLQIRLYDADKCAVLTLPPLEKCLHILPPLFEDDDLPKADESLVGFSETTEDGEIINAFDENGNYIRTVWQSGDLISVARLNKIEEGLENAVYVLDDYVTKEELGKAIESVDVTGQLVDYAKKSEIPTKVSQLTNDSSYLSSIPSEYVTDEELNAKGYLTQHQDLSAYAKKSDLPTVPTKVSELTNDKNYISSIPSEYVTDIELTNKGYVTESYVKNEIANAQLGGDNTEIDLSGYATKDDLKAKADEKHTHDEYLTEHQDLSDYAKKSDIPTDYLTEIPSEYITETELNNKGYLTEHQSLTDYAKKSEIPSLDGYATEDYVDTAVANAQLGGEEVDLSGYAKTSDIPTATSQLTNDSGFLTEIPNDYAKKSDIPTDYLTSIPSEYVTNDELTAKGYLTEHQSLEGYAKTSDIPSLEGYAKTSDIPTVPTNVSAFTNDSGYLTEHQSLDGYATTQYVDNKFWSGTQAEYDALETKNPNTIYLIEEE